MAGTLNTSLSDVQWVTRGYWMALAAALPAAPSLQRHLGASRLWRWSLVGFTAASLLAVLAPSVPTLVAVRVAQGGCGGLFLTGQRILAEAADQRRMGRVLSVVGLTFVLAAFFAALSLVGGSVLLPRCYETFCGLSAGSTNLLLLTFGVGVVVTKPVAGCLCDHLGDGAICVLGLTILTLATGPFVFLSANSEFARVQILQALHGIGVGLAAIPSMTAAFRAASSDLADATAAANILGRVGGSLGSALVASSLSRGRTRRWQASSVAHALLVVSAFCALLTAAACA